MITVIIPYDKLCKSIASQLDQQKLKYDKETVAGYEDDAKALMHLHSRWLIDDRVQRTVSNKIHSDVMKHIKTKNHV